MARGYVLRAAEAKREYPARFSDVTFQAINDFAAAHNMSFNRALYELVSYGLVAVRRKEQRQRRVTGKPG